MLTVIVPASSANIGSGFDSFGVALSLYNKYQLLELLPAKRYDIEAVGEGGKGLASPESNLLIRSYEAAMKRFDVPLVGLKLRSYNAIPLARGLGSSASAVVGGVILANVIGKINLPKEKLLPIMVELEGHPDNVVPSYIGGFVISSWDGKDVKFVQLPPFREKVKVVVAVPDVTVDTKRARDVLPRNVSLQDAVFNLSRAALFAASWMTGKLENLPWAMEDKLHQPYRAKLFPGGEEILERVKSAPGCLGAAISGSGPSVLAFVRGNPTRTAKEMCSVFTEKGLRSRFFVLDVDQEGARIQTSETNISMEADKCPALS
ncbi:MAG: homoserine kinase [Acetomicrobium sp.]|nr:homoserine kinase [Acetomicrobium sp.]